MYLSEGRVTQNGSWISYKTYLYAESISTYQKLADELKAMLSSKNIDTDEDYHAVAAINSTKRKGAITIKVASSDINMNIFPFESHSVD